MWYHGLYLNLLGVVKHDLNLWSKNKLDYLQMSK